MTCSIAPGRGRWPAPPRWVADFGLVKQEGYVTVVERRLLDPVIEFLDVLCPDPRGPASGAEGSP
jgi:hypothetical protein